MKILFFYLALLFTIPILPVFNSLDVIGFQWFIFSIVNSIFILYLFFQKKTIKFPISFWPFRFYVLFFFFCIISLSYSKNINLSLVDLSRVTNIFLSLIILFNIDFSKLNFYYFSFFVSCFLIVDISFSLYPFLEASITNSTPFFKILSDNSNPQLLIGLNGNKNITAAYTLIKLPFLLYFLIKTKSNYIKLFFSILLFLVTSILFLLKSRAAYLSLSATFVIFLFHSLFYSKRSIKFLFVLLLSIICTSLFTKFAYNFSIANELSTIRFTNESSSSRFLLWENAIDASVNSNLFGLGLGNWKIESLPYWNKNGSDYIVPYHAHNDFFELLAEIGIFGSISYLFLFVFAFYYLFKNYLLSKSLIEITLFCSLMIYFVDACLNFPLERYTMQIFFSFLIFIISHRYAKEFN